VDAILVKAYPFIPVEEEVNTPLGMGIVSQVGGGRVWVRLVDEDFDTSFTPGEIKVGR
jgi:hypothetical protein